MILYRAWIPLLPFSLSKSQRSRCTAPTDLQLLFLVRFAGGIITILLNNNPSVGLIIATLILLGVGVIPLIISMLGFIRIMYAPPPLLPLPP